jgi:heme/copper-type cytochrome/quinol oxidase subunit 3
MAAEGSVPVGAGGGDVPVARDQAEAPAERRERGVRSLSLAARGLAGASVFFFLAFFFAYFYLRSVNSEGMWRPHHVKPLQGLGAAFIVCVIASALLAFAAGRREARDSPDWVVPGVLSVVFGLVAVALQCIEYTVQKFGPTDGAFASVFIAWTGFYLLAVLGSMYWLEITVATELRERRHPSALPGEGEHFYEDPDKLLLRGLDAAVFMWCFLAGVGVVTYVTLYLL